jgi:REP element-mobilizing transposase RayT
MARPLRIEYDGALYHVTSRGNERKAIFKDDGDRKLFLDTLAQVNKRFHWICHAYCLLDNHYHLVIETPDGNLSKGIGSSMGYTPNPITSAMAASVIYFREGSKEFSFRKTAIFSRFAGTSFLTPLGRTLPAIRGSINRVVT